MRRRFDAWRAAHRRALIPYLTAGFPEPSATLPILRAIADAGADIVELGVPFSDPLADGPTIQRASQRAIEAGTDLARVLELLAAIRAERELSVVVFSYLNPVLAYGPERFVRDAASAGAEGVLITDLPAGADPALETLFEGCALSFIRLLAPTTPPARARAIAARAQGFLYYVSRTGVTGAQADLPSTLEDELRALRALTEVPIAVGFGVSSAAQAAAVARFADGVVVGSALIDRVEREGARGAASLIGELRAALDAAP